VTYGYETEVMLFADAQVSPDARAHLEVVADASFLACRDRCIPGQVRMASRIVVENAGPARPSTEAALFARFEQRLPQSAQDAGVVVSAEYSTTALRAGEPFAIVVSVGLWAQGPPSCAREVVLAGGLSQVAFDPPESLELIRAPAGPGQTDRQFQIGGRLLLGAIAATSFGVIVPLLVDGQAVTVSARLELPLLVSR